MDETNQARILAALRKNEGGFVSGETLAETLGISRPGVWKHINRLRELGYEIESRARSGYRLTGAPDSLTHDIIEPNLGTSWLGRHYHYIEKIGSTNDYALALAAQDAPHGTVVVAGEQTKGRGRLGRQWLSSARSGIYMSILLRDKLPLRVAALSTYVVSLALVKLLHRDFGLAASIKWPNDILISGAKAAGILTEMQSDQDSARFIVIGIGINVNHTRKDFSGEFRYPPTSIAIEAGRTVRRQEVLTGFLRQLESDYEVFRKQGFSALLQEYEQFSEIMGKRITVLYGESEVTGEAAGFSPEGALLLLLSGGERETVWVGDVVRIEGAV